MRERIGRWPGTIALLAILTIAGALSGSGAASAASFPREVSAQIKPASANVAREITIAPLGPRLSLKSYQRSVVLPPLSADVLEVLKRDDAMKGRLRIGIGRSFEQAIAVNGTTAPASGWTVSPDGWRVWSLEISSPGALGLRVHVESLSLPAGVRLLVYDPQNPTPAAAPITSESLAGQREAWAETVFAERLVLECQAPPEVDPNAVAFTVTGVSHLYTSPFLKDAGPCNKDVTCYPAYANEAAGVARMLFVDGGSAFLCTGCLLNDTDPGTFIDYFLTANHCIGDQTVASTLELYWFYQTSDCNGVPPSLSSVPHTSGGADFLATSPASAGNDFTFLRLRQASPGGVVYLGWSTGLPATGAAIAGIHHPQGDYKRICFGHEVSSDADFWHVRWQLGVTEPGSSGSPLLNANHQVVGQLFGGLSACDMLSGIDDYGRFDVTFNSISQWLAPGPAPLAAPLPLGPVCGGRIAIATPVLRWARVGHALGYTVQIFRGDSCSGSPIHTSPQLTPATAAYRVPLGVLDANGFYSWQVKAVADGSNYLDSDWSGCCGFTLGVFVRGTYYGLFFETNASGMVVDPVSNGSFSMVVSTNGVFSGRLYQGGVGYPFHGQFEPDGTLGFPIPRRNTTSLTVRLGLDLASGSENISGLLGDGEWQAALSGFRVVLNARTNPAPASRQGKYTVRLQATGTGAPEGIGAGAASVDASGWVRLQGRLPDNTPVAQTVPTSAKGEWPLYASAYRGKGSIFGWLKFEDGPAETVSGQPGWSRPSIPGAQYYPDGFTTLVDASGLHFVAPPPGQSVLSFGPAIAVFSGGNLGAPFTNDATLRASGAVIQTGPYKLTLKVAPGNGLFSGWAQIPGLARSNAVFGAVFQDPMNQGWGYFLGTNLSGSFQLEGQ